MHGVPVLRGHDGHTGNGKIFVQTIKSRAGPATAAADHGGSGLVGVGSAFHIEQAIQESAQRAVGSRIVDGRPHDKAIRRLQEP